MDQMHVLLLTLLALALAGCGALGALLRRALRRAALLRDALSEAGEGNLCRLISATGLIVRGEDGKDVRNFSPSYFLRSLLGKEIEGLEDFPPKT